MRRAYLAEMEAVTTGIGPVLRPVLAAVAQEWSGHALPALAGARGLCIADVTGSEHATLSADARIVVLPFEDATGTPLAFTAGLGNIPSGKRSAIQTSLESEHVPMQGFTLATPISAVLRRAVHRMLHRQALGADDWNEGLDTLVSSIQSAKRQRIRDALIAIGNDPSVIAAGDTIREAIAKMAAQDTRFLRGAE